MKMAAWLRAAFAALFSGLLVHHPAAFGRAASAEVLFTQVRALDGTSDTLSPRADVLVRGNDAEPAPKQTAVIDGLIGATPASSADGAVAEDHPQGTNVQVTLYGWLAGATGEFRPSAGAPTLEFDNSFGEVLENLDVAFFASAQMRRGAFVAMADVSYASLSRDGLVPPGIPASGKVSQLAMTGLAGARVEDSTELSVDLLAGARLWNLDGRIEVPLVGVSVAPGKTFVDPILAARINAGVAPRLSAIFHADIGGLGIGSDFTYQFVGTLNCRAAGNTWISAGWRRLHLDYADGGTRFKGSQTGPLFGVTQRF